MRAVGNLQRTMRVMHTSELQKEVRPKNRYFKNLLPNQLSACGSIFFGGGQSSSRIRKHSGFLCANLTQESGKFPEMKHLMFCSTRLSLRSRHSKAGYLPFNKGVNVTNRRNSTEPTTWVQRLCNVRKSGISTTKQSWSFRENKQIGK